MKILIRQIAQFAGLTGTCVTLVAGAVQGISAPALVLRGFVVGMAIFLAIELLGRIVGETVLRVAVEHYVQRQTRVATAPEPEVAAKRERKPARPARAA